MDNEKKMGRPKEKNPRNVQLKIMLTQEESDQIDALAEKLKMNKSRLIRNLLLDTVDDAEFLNKIGVLPIIQKAMALKDSLEGVDYWKKIKKDAGY